MASEVVTLMCMTTKKKFEVENPPIEVLNNGRYAYRVMCPWKGKNNKDLYAFKFCSTEAYERYLERTRNNEDEELNKQEDEIDKQEESEH